MFPERRGAFIASLRLFLLLVFALTAYEGLDSWQRAYPWRSGDWMINYAGGFIRRGLLGQGFLALWHTTQIPPTLAMTVFQLACYGLFFLFAYRLLAGAPEPGRYALLVFSPAIFLFHIYDPHGGFRKEILVYPLLAWLVWLRRRQGRIAPAVTALVAGLLFPAMILSHEMLVVVWPLVLLVLLWDAPRPRSRIVLGALLSAPSALATLAALHWSRADPRQLLTICHAWGPYAVPDCHDGAIAFLGSDARLGFGQVLHAIGAQRYLVVYPVVTLLSLLTFWPVRASIGALLRDRWHRLLVSASLLGALALCAVAVDWGRFLDLELVSLFLLSFLPAVELPVRPARPAAPGALRGAARRLRLAGMLVFNTLWHIPHVGLNFFLGYTISRLLLGLHG